MAKRSQGDKINMCMTEIKCLVGPIWIRVEKCAVSKNKWPNRIVASPIGD